jgi:hypothetical protein
MSYNRSWFIDKHAGCWIIGYANLLLFKLFRMSQKTTLLTSVHLCGVYTGGLSEIFNMLDFSDSPTNSPENYANSTAHHIGGYVDTCS